MQTVGTNERIREADKLLWQNWISTDISSMVAITSHIHRSHRVQNDCDDVRNYVGDVMACDGC